MLIKFLMEMESKQKKNQFAQQKAKQFSSRILNKIMMMQKNGTIENVMKSSSNDVIMLNCGSSELHEIFSYNEKKTRRDAGWLEVVEGISKRRVVFDLLVTDPHLNGNI